MAYATKIFGLRGAALAAAIALTLLASVPSIAIASPGGYAEHPPVIDEANYPDDEAGLPDYMRNWDLMEPIFDPFNTDTGTYAVNWNWNQEGAESVVYYLQEGKTQEFLAPNVTTHFDTRVMMTGKPNGTYWYRVKAVKGELSSNWSRADSITISIKPVNPEDDMGVIVHDYHGDEMGLPYLTEKIELFVNVPVVFRVGDDPETTKWYTIILRQMLSEPVKLAVIEICEPHQFVVVTENASYLDLDGDGADDVKVQYKGQHENGQAYVAFTVVGTGGGSEPPYALACAAAAAVIASIYLVIRWRRVRKLRNAGTKESALLSEGGGI